MAVRTCILLSLLVAGVGSTTRAADPLVTVERRLSLMGTWLDLSISAPTRARALQASEAVIAEIAATERRLSTWTEDSELSRLNDAPPGPTVVSALLAEDLGAAMDCARLTDGAFDPTLGTLVEAWSLRHGPRRPTPEALARARGDMGFRHVEVSGRVISRDRAVRFEEGGFGKGIALRRALAGLRAQGITRARLNLGGQVASLGEESWQALSHPRARTRTAARVLLGEGSLATSGNSERGARVAGESLGHILDPRSGQPAEDFGALSVRARDPVLADCLSTGLYVLGPDRAVAFAERTEGVDVVVGLDGAHGITRWLTSAGVRMVEATP